MLLNDNVAICQRIEPTRECKHIEDRSRCCYGIGPRRLDLSQDGDRLRRILFNRDNDDWMAHILGSNQPILQNNSGRGRRESRNMHISYSHDWNLAGICDAGMLVHLRSIGNLDVQLVAGADKEAF